MQFAYFESPIGLLEIKASTRGLVSVQRVEEKQDVEEASAGWAVQAKEQLREYFAKERRQFDLTFDWSDGTPFNQSVWQIVKDIPYGHTTTYSAIAEQLENPKAVRAVGLANKYNPIAIIVPCHRVIAKSGDLQGYFYGLDTKRQLLELENPESFARQGSLF
ncbi:MAG: methylated-DNA--[protein]-cysteine S-methyltransferase [Bacteroidota bacterium]